MAGRHRIGPLLIWGTALIAGAALVDWFLENFEQRTELIDAGASAQARNNPFLAAERFLRRVGMAAESVDGRGLLRALPPTQDTLVVDGLGALNDQRRAALHEWIESGGRLFAAPTEASGEDASAARDFVVGYGVQLRTLEDVEPGETIVAEATFADYPEALELELPAALVLRDMRGRADGGISAGDDARILHFDIGEGRLTVTSDMAPFTNAQIAKRDHALFLALLTGQETGGKVWLLHDSGMPWLGALLWRHAPYALIAAGALMMALLWQLGGRLGPLRPAPEPRRRDLLAHLQALSHFHWRHGRGSRLTQVTRERIELAWLRRHPPLGDLDQAGRAAWIGQHTGIAAAEVQAALYPPAAVDGRLVADTRVLQRLWRGSTGAVASRNSLKHGQDDRE